MPAGSLTPERLDLTTVSDGPWDDDSSVVTEIEDANGHRVARVFKTSNVDSSSLPWQNNKQLIQDALGYASQAQEREDRVMQLEERVVVLERYRMAVESLSAHPGSARRLLRDLRKEGLL